jgi:hypothetical protein
MLLLQPKRATTIVEHLNLVLLIALFRGCFIAV